MSISRTGLTQLTLLIGLYSSVPVLAQEPDPGLWDRLRGLVAQEGEQLQEVLKGQERMGAEEASLQAQLEQGRRLRAMHREAVLLSELNVAWIYDQLDHWDCRIAEQKVHEVETRIADFDGFGQRLEALCDGFGAREGRQQQVCARQRTELSQAITELEDLGQRYSAACPAQAEQLIKREGEQPWQ